MRNIWKVYFFLSYALDVERIPLPSKLDLGVNLIVNFEIFCSKFDSVQKTVK